MNERGIEIIYGIFNIYFFEAFFIVYFVCVGNLQSLSSTGNIFVCVNIPFKYAKFGPLFFFFSLFPFFFMMIKMIILQKPVLKLDEK